MNLTAMTTFSAKMLRVN